MSKTMILELPEWTTDLPVETGTYLKCDRYGRVSLVGLRSVPKTQYDLYQTDHGTRVNQPDLAPHRWCGPLRREHLFPGPVLAEVLASIDKAPQDRVDYCKKVVKDCPSSKKAKAALAEAEAALAEHLAAKAGGAK